MTVTNTLRKVDAVDRLIELRLDLQARKGAGSEGRRFGFSGAIPLFEVIEIEDTVKLDDDKILLEDVMEMDDANSIFSHEFSGAYRVTEEDGTVIDGQPGIVELSDVGNERGTNSEV
jgi:tetrahydromethanopterin S-methyltransferase subunit A